MNPKPGYLTTEFLLTLIPQVLAILVMFRVVGTEDVSTLSGALTRIVESVAAIIGAAWVLVRYVQGRAMVKQSAATVMAMALRNQP